MYDVIVVGARCAGSAAALQLARRGYRVLLVDRASFPSDTVSTHYVHQPGVAALARWGLLDEVATHCPPIERYLFDVGPFALQGAPPAAGDQHAAYAPRRTTLDAILVTAAVSSGAELRERFTVKELVHDGERVVGIRGRSDGGALVTERARLVVGADGLHSTVARMVEAASYYERPATSCLYYSYFSGITEATVRLYPRPGNMLISAPTNDGLTVVTILFPQASFEQVRADTERHFFAALATVPELHERVRSGRREESFRGSGQLAGFFRRSHGPGWALVGDAGYHKNPVSAEGITDAFCHSELLVAAVDDALSGRVAEADALAAYERDRNAVALPIYEMTAQLARLEPPDEQLQRLLAALRDNQPQTDRFLGTIAGTVAIPDFFGPDNLASIFATTSGLAVPPAEPRPRRQVRAGP